MKKSVVQVDLSDKTAVITGAGRGIGKAIAEHFACAGAAIVAAARSAGQIEDTVQAVIIHRHSRWL